MDDLLRELNRRRTENIPAGVNRDNLPMLLDEPLESIASQRARERGDPVGDLIAPDEAAMLAETGDYNPGSIFSEITTEDLYEEVARIGRENSGRPAIGVESTVPQERRDRMAALMQEINRRTRPNNSR